MKTKTYLPLAAIACALALSALSSCVGTPVEPNLNKVIDLKFTSVDGKDVDLARLKGKVVLINFWATWCGPSVAEVPGLLKAYEKHHSKDFEIIGISLDTDKGVLAKFTKEKGMTWPQFFDGRGWQNEISSRFGIHAIPVMWVVDRDGKLISTRGRSVLDSLQ